jgi:hypothetical protein
MLYDSYMRTTLSRMRVDDLIAQADAERLARSGRPPRAARAWRVGALRMLARGLRVEREIDFDLARVPRR